MSTVQTSDSCSEAKSFKSQKSNEIFHKMYRNYETADVFFTFKLSNGLVQRIPAHKSVLGLGSPVFYQMFFGQLRETGDVLIDDVMTESFEQFLQFFYFNEVTLTNGTVTEVLYLTNKYDLPECSAIFVDFIEGILNTNTMCWGYDLAILYGLKELSSFCENEIAFDARKIFQSDSFERCTRQTLKQILKLNNLNCTELDVYNACIKWADHQTGSMSDSKEISRKRRSEELTIVEQQKQHLGDCFELIRFPTLTDSQFVQCIQNHPGILNSDEIVDIKRYINESLPLVVATRFNENRRQWNPPKSFEKEQLNCQRLKRDFQLELNRPQLCSRCDYIDSDDYTLNQLMNVGSLTFTSNKRILLNGIKCECIIDAERDQDDSPFLTKFEIWTRSEENKLVFTKLKEIEYDCLTDIRFKNPIVIDAFKEYEIRITFVDSKQSYYISIIGEYQKSIILKNGIEIKFNKGNENLNHTPASLISQLLFSSFY